MRLASPYFVEKEGELSRLLNAVDRLCERLHVEFPTITEEDYRVFGSELKVLISTLKALRQESLAHKDLKPYNDRMRQQIADLEELDHDIKTFRINALKNKELQQAMKAVGKVDFSYLFQ